MALALVAAAPFLTRPGLPHGTDAELHVYRAAELGHTLRAGALYPRWAPDLFFGFGYPIFNYYAPLTYYLANGFDVLPGVDIVAGVKGVFVLGLFVASLGAYLLGRELFGPAAGVVAAASFTFAPYVAFIDPHARGDLAEHFAVCLLPLAFYAFRRLMSGVGGRGALVGSVLTLAGLVFSHNLLGLVGGGLLLAYCGWEVLFGAGRHRAGWGGAAFILATGLIAFFWVPALLERGAVELDVVGPGHFDFHEHFLSVGELLAPSRVLDLGAVSPRHWYNLGLAQWLLALPALAVLLRYRLPRRRTRLSQPHSSLLFFFLAGLALVLLMLPVSTPVWDLVPGMVYFQFPWRFLGAANLMLAVCAGGATALLPQRAWRGPVLGAALAITLLLALPILYPPMWSADFGGTAPREIIEWERHSLALGTTSTGDFVPVDAARGKLRPASTLLDSYGQPGPIDRVNRATVPEGATVEVIGQGALWDRFAVSTPRTFVLRLYTFYFPGWRAYVDGAEVEIEVAGPEGFITFWVPKGEHEVLVRFEDTAPRTAGWIISGVALALLAVALVWMRGAGKGEETRFSERTWFLRRQEETGFLGKTRFLWLAGVFLLFVAAKSWGIDPHDDWMRVTSPPGQALVAQHQKRATFEVGGMGQIELLGYDLPRERVRSGDAFPAVLYWRALAPLDENYQSFLHLARPLNILWGQDDHLNPGDLPTERWPLDRYVWDEYEIRVLPATPPGQYVLNLGVYSEEEGIRLAAHDESGQPAGDSLPLALLEVERPLREPRLPELGMTHWLTVTFPEAGVTLIGYDQPYPKVKLPGTWPVTLFWRADRDQPAALARDLVFLDPDSNEVWRTSGVPAGYPFEGWHAGEIVRDPIVFAAASPVSLVTEKYRFGVVLSADAPLYAEGADDPLVLIGKVKFRVKENEWLEGMRRVHE